jgi:Mg-chelatase subunit ChlD
VLPVSTDVRSNVELPLVALIIVMDRSQSMTAGSPSRLELAKEGAIEMVDLAYERDQLGFITFSDREEWVFRLREATQQGKREMLEAIWACRRGAAPSSSPPTAPP